MGISKVSISGCDDLYCVHPVAKNLNTYRMLFEGVDAYGTLGWETNAT